MEENLLTIFLYYFLRHVALCNTPVHSLPFDMTVGFFFFHIETADEKPFSFVDQSYFFHLLLKRKVGLLRTSQPFPGAGQPAQRCDYHRPGSRFCQRENPEPGSKSLSFIKEVGAHEVQRH